MSGLGTDTCSCSLLDGNGSPPVKKDLENAEATKGDGDAAAEGLRESSDDPQGGKSEERSNEEDEDNDGDLSGDEDEEEEQDQALVS